MLVAFGGEASGLVVVDVVVVSVTVGGVSSVWKSSFVISSSSIMPSSSTSFFSSGPRTTTSSSSSSSSSQVSSLPELTTWLALDRAMPRMEEVDAAEVASMSTAAGAAEAALGEEDPPDAAAEPAEN